MPQRINAFTASNIAPQVKIEKILPWFTANRTRLDLGEIDVAQSEDGQRFKQYSRLVSESEYDACLLSALNEFSPLRESEKPGIILGIIFDPPYENIHSI